MFSTLDNLLSRTILQLLQWCQSIYKDGMEKQVKAVTVSHLHVICYEMYCTKIPEFVLLIRFVLGEWLRHFCVIKSINGNRNEDISQVHRVSI